nr:hypothetical protein [Tanacetum cinerariifolium]
MNWGEVNPTHAYYNGSRTSKDTEDPSWSTSIKTGSHECHLQHWKHFGSPYCVVIILDMNIVSYGQFSYLDFFRLLDENVGSSPSRIILFGTIPAEIHAETPTIPTIVSTLPHTSLFLYTDSSDNDTSKRPPSQDPEEESLSVTIRLSCIEVSTRSFSSDHFSSDDSSLDSSSDSSLDSSSDYSLDSSFDDSIEESYEAYTDLDIDSDVQENIDADTTAAKAAAAREADVSGKVGIGSDREEKTEEEADSEDMGTIEIGVDMDIKPVVLYDVYKFVSDDMPESADEKGLDALVWELHDKLVKILVWRIKVIESVRRDQGHRMLAASQQSAVMLDRIRVLKRDNMKLRDVIDELIAKRVAKVLEAYDAARNPRPMIKSKDEQEDVNENRNGNGNSQFRTDVAYAITWKELMKLMTKVYCPSNEIQKMKTELWNMTVRNNDLTTCTQRFQEPVLLCTKMVLEKEDRVDKFIRDNKRRLNNNSKDNRVQQPPFKRQNGNRKNVARSYSVGNSEKRGYAWPLPYCNKCKLHHEGQCTVKCGHCADRSFMSTTFSALLDVVPSTLDVSYAIELAAGRIA